jgi:hypothetical protein
MYVKPEHRESDSKSGSKMIKYARIFHMEKRVRNVILILLWDCVKNDTRDVEKWLKSDFPPYHLFRMSCAREREWENATQKREQKAAESDHVRREEMN